jgi:hypothetical protein
MLKSAPIVHQKSKSQKIENKKALASSRIALVYFENNQVYFEISLVYSETASTIF